MLTLMMRMSEEVVDEYEDGGEEEEDEDEERTGDNDDDDDIGNAATADDDFVDGHCDTTAVSPGRHALSMAVSWPGLHACWSGGMRSCTYVDDTALSVFCLNACLYVQVKCERSCTVPAHVYVPSSGRSGSNSTNISVLPCLGLKPIIQSTP